MINFRAATIEDLALLRHWDEQPHTVASDPNHDWGWETKLLRPPEWREQLIAELNGRPIGFVQIIDPLLEDGHYWGEVAPNLRAIDIWIGEASDLGKGYGTETMRQAIARCFASPEVTAIIIDPLALNAKDRKFYEKLGFSFIENRTFDEDFCAVYQLDRNDWEKKRN